MEKTKANGVVNKLKDLLLFTTSKEDKLITLKEYVDNKPMPEMMLVDMREELRSGNKSLFSRRLYASMKEKLEKGEQIILFLNRRGFSTFVSCRSCGYVFHCENCDISMTYHKNGFLVCHNRRPSSHKFFSLNSLLLSLQ